ncbi:ROK family protein [Salmonella enterica]|uniref:ROK family protein n=3 Tax=Salmonella enterica TaxID=28901 RepID=A0A5U5BJB1_SALER|nr:MULTISPECIES: ROK family protein [Salmonella]EBH8224284.1 ROK family protein [Salmonella enterica subsp. enterica serovar Agona str. SL483]MBJ5684030.1 ROK family protein [Salmonella enterica subsp. enterica serovar London]MCL8678393.1 ROK family protein [Salmonella enterica subsp. enterica serovar Enteritidis]EAO3649623.1 ROK family protein [Salmonella enterica]EAP5794422.1 ROK family protein [Salmonella enterica subsp. enterica serovar Goldcoast]
MQQYIGIDVGGTHVKYGVINSDGEELTHYQFDTPEDASTFTRKWQDVVARCQQDYDIAAIGVSFPGHINPHNGHAAKAGALAYLDDVNLMELFSGLTDLPLVVENDANCAALGEMWRGAGQHYDNLVCITIGTGIGGGIIVGRELYRGAHFHAGEFGVMPVGNNGESMHKIASTSGLMASCRQALALPAEEMPPADVIFERMATDVHLREAVNDWARYLSRGVYSVISMFDPGVVLIGGGISEQEKLYPLLTRHLETFEMWEALQVPIQPCQLGNQAGRLGAVWLAQQQLDRS